MPVERRHLLLFAIMCTIWGSTWIAIRLGVAEIPPFSFAALRHLAAGLLLLGIARRLGASMTPGASLPRLVASALFVNTGCYALLFWGMQSVPSGLSAVIQLALLPVGLFGVGLLFGEEVFSRRKAAGVALGLAGLLVLFWPRLSPSGGAGELAGMAAIALSTFSLAIGFVLSRALLRNIDLPLLAAQQNLIGAAGLFVLAALFEPFSAASVAALARPAVLASWIFLVLGGSIVAFTIYLELLRAWGPVRAGLNAFVSPVIAVVIGVVLFAEPFGAHELAGSMVMLLAAGLVIRDPRLATVEGPS